ncbi:hypothetical protein E5347_01065 [Clostridium sartagoforme]|uniref:Uncharacterized protein n=1 Tax=Clostridium sartagoforme TaxID=84031 RepID=A0A4S2DMC3_9CLOT|nr:hypothetical protein [Clostridium sartagoforme]MBS5936997.1 hypothetical protein [Clostridium sp.]TGY43429.1 hypothetical protein E5347_01065 [Clostridium sartagoforme]
MYEYRKHLRGSFLNYCVAIVVLLSLALLIGLGAVFSVGSKLKGTDFLLIGAITVGMFIFIFIEFTLIYFLFLKRFKYINVKLDEEAIIYNNKKKKIVIPYDDIISMRYPSIRYTGGWMEIKYNGGKIRLTVVLENIGDFMYNLKEILDKRGRSAVYNEKKSFNFFKTATFSDESWERIYKIYKYLLSIEYLSVFIAIFLSRFGVIQNNFTSIIVFFLAPTIGYLISEIIIGTRVSKRVVHDEFRVIPRDLSKETKFARILIAVSTLICIFIMVLI